MENTYYMRFLHNGMVNAFWCDESGCAYYTSVFVPAPYRSVVDPNEITPSNAMRTFLKLREIGVVNKIERIS